MTALTMPRTGISRDPAFRHVRRRIRRHLRQLKRFFTDHPGSVNESYFVHLWFTVHMSVRFVGIAAALLIHGLIPFLFTTTASRNTEKMLRIMRERLASANKHQYGDDI